MTITHNAFVEDLKDGEFVAVNAAGTPIGRAGSKEALEQAHAADPAVQILTAADIAKAEPTLAEAATSKLDGPFAAVVAQGIEANPVVPEAKPELPADADTKAPIADGSAFDHDKDGHVGGSAAKTSTKKAGAKK